MNETLPLQLPSGYLLRNFQRVVAWVKDLYWDILSADELEYLYQFDQLSTAAQHLYLRLVTRSRELIPVATLNYAEVPNVNAALGELAQRNLATINPPMAIDELLNLYSKAKLAEAFNLDADTSHKKGELIESIQTQFSLSVINRTICTKHPYTCVLRRDKFEFLLLLFFGNGRQDLSEFIKTELGHVRYENYPIHRETRYFRQRDDVDILRHYLTVREQLENEEALQSSETLQALFSTLPRHQDRPELKRRHDKIALTIARQLERLEDLPNAYRIYQTVASHPSRERQARILVKQDQALAALNLCVAIRADSSHPEELEFAEQFGATLARKLDLAFPEVVTPDISQTSLTLAPSQQSVEQRVARALTDDNHQCYYVENALFCGLFGLYFWDIIFATIPGAFFHPFQRGPVHLHSEFFYSDRRDLIEARLAEMNQPEWQNTVRHFLKCAQGINNAFVDWDIINPMLVEQALRYIPTTHLQYIFRQIAQHPGLFRNGFPDLIRFSRNGYELVEVKAPNDRLQPNQRRWFRHFEAAGIPARLLNVSWSD